ncbi:proline-serine-threonine phosphatase-interacting protein 1-like isoform X2 [Haliotis rubra]|uniref:proline-serine-threonine phosphatase-interacting protein 1-like isoform X2 n=1 Tax=Haliotis rubra TaxID=36100 RepID=UPI001EE5BF02|nr:proline-serine-threonine phosphatase-interacting protein 1-like isoform X2 [Haliotis rubra]
MTRLSQYSEAFWGTHFTSTAGFEALALRMKDGRHMCKEFEEYLKQRYEAENRYSKDLHKLERNMKLKDDIGVLEKSWNKLKEEMEKMVQIHQDAAANFLKQMDDVKKFNEAQTTKKKAMEETVKKYQSNKNSLYSRCMNNHKNYKDKCREKDSASDNYNLQRSTVTTQTKDLEKANKAKARAEDEAVKAETAYKSSLDALESARDLWEKEMQAACDVFQNLDHERIKFLRENLWVSLNVDSQVAVEIDDCCESVRRVLENCSMENDICTFIEKYQTGTERPACIVFEDYYANTDTMGRRGQRSGGSEVTATEKQWYHNVRRGGGVFLCVSLTVTRSW